MIKERLKAIQSFNSIIEMKKLIYFVRFLLQKGGTYKKIEWFTNIIFCIIEYYIAEIDLEKRFCDRIRYVDDETNLYFKLVFENHTFRVYQVLNNVNF